MKNLEEVDFKDKIGQSLNKGDAVVFIPPYTHHMGFGIVSHFSKKQVTIEYNTTKSGRPYQTKVSRKFEDVVKIDQHAYIQYKLIGSFE